MALKQTHTTCYFYSIINCMLLSKYGRRLLLYKLRKFYKTLSDEQKKSFLDPRLCFRKENFSFYKFVYFYWTNVIKKRKTEKSAALLENLGLNSNVNRGANVILAREKIFNSVGVKFSNIFVDKTKQAPIKSTSDVVVMRDSKVYKYITLTDNIPTVLPNNSDFVIDHGVIVMEGHRITDGVRKNFSHALSLVRLPNDDYKVIDSAGGGIKLICDWRNPKNFTKLFNAKWPYHSYGSAFNYDDWGYNSIVYVRKNQPIFSLSNLDSKTVTKPTPTMNLGVNEKGRKILRGPRGGKFVLLGRSKKYI